MIGNSVHTGTFCAFLLLLLLLFFSSSSAQQKVSSFLLKPVPRALLGDFRSETDSLPEQGPKGQAARSSKEKSTTLAMALSAVVPGAGQIYVGRYWTLPLIWGFGGYFVSIWIKADDLYVSARERYNESVKRGENGGLGSDQLKYERDFYRDQRDKFAFYLALTYLLNIVDAYVGASLYSFDVSDDLGGNVSVRLNVPLR